MSFCGVLRVCFGNVMSVCLPVCVVMSVCFGNVMSVCLPVCVVFVLGSVVCIL